MEEEKRSSWIEMTAIVLIIAGFFLMGGGTGFISRLASSIVPEAKPVKNGVDLLSVGIGALLVLAGTIMLGIQLRRAK